MHVITGLDTGGAETALCRLLESLTLPRFDQVVVCLSDQGALSRRANASSARIFYLGLRASRPNPLALLTLRRHIVRERPAILHGWMYHANLAIALAALRKYPPLVLGIRQSLSSLDHEKRLTRLVIRAGQLLSSRAKMIVYNSEVSAQQHQRMGYRHDRTKVIPNGFDLEVFRPNSETRSDVRAANGIPENAVVVGHVARLHPMKDHLRFLRIAVRLADRYPELHVLLVGAGVTADQPLWRGVVPVELGDRFHFLGERDDIANLLRAIDVLCLSSAWGEAFPNVLGEAMASGVPCVATNVGDSSAIVGDTGVVVPPSDDTALYDGLHRMLAAGPGTREKLGWAARERVQQKYSMDAVVAQYIDLYTSLAMRGRR